MAVEGKALSSPRGIGKPVPSESLSSEPCNVSSRVLCDVPSTAEPGAPYPPSLLYSATLLGMPPPQALIYSLTVYLPSTSPIILLPL